MQSKASVKGDGKVCAQLTSEANAEKYRKPTTKVTRSIITGCSGPRNNCNLRRERSRWKRIKAGKIEEVLLVY